MKLSEIKKRLNPSLAKKAREWLEEIIIEEVDGELRAISSGYNGNVGRYTLSVPIEGSDSAADDAISEIKDFFANINDTESEYWQIRSLEVQASIGKVRGRRQESNNPVNAWQDYKTGRRTPYG